MTISATGCPVWAITESQANTAQSPSFFTDVIRPGTKTFLAAKGDFARIQQVTKEFPAGGRFIMGDTQGLSHHIRSLAGGHGTGDAFETMTV
ncbi:hypothetical protein GGI1_02053, partial [Acidithiobacillus sp. GGI-221]